MSMLGLGFRVFRVLTLALGLGFGAFGFRGLGVVYLGLQKIEMIWTSLLKANSIT